VSGENDQGKNTANLGFWFEFGSTYSYLSVARIEGLAAAAGVQVVWEPFLLGPVFAEQGWHDSPFNLYPAKGRYMWRDIERQCAAYGIPFAKPSRFPRNSLLGARLARATSEHWLPDFVRAVFRANFAEDREIGDTAEIRSILDSLGQPGGSSSRPGCPRTSCACANRRGGPGNSGSSVPRASWSAANFSGGTTVLKTTWHGPAPDQAFPLSTTLRCWSGPA
jgi:2-hydroxychromene-2-carboxylate isomerase